MNYGLMLPGLSKVVLLRDWRSKAFSFNHSGKNQTADWICHGLQDKGSVEINSWRRKNRWLRGEVEEKNGTENRCPNRICKMVTGG